MADALLLFVNGMTVLFAAFAAAFSWGVYKRYGTLSGGIAMPVAFSFMLLNRVIVLSDVVGAFQEYDAQLRFLGAGCFFIFSGVLLDGLSKIKNEADALFRTDRQAMKAIAEFEKRRAGKKGAKNG